MTLMIIRNPFHFLLLAGLSLLCCKQVFSQSKWRSLSEGIESTDSLVVVEEDTTRIEIIRNLWLGIEIRSMGKYGDTGAPTWLGKDTAKTGWKTFTSDKLGITFDYPPNCRVRRRVEEEGTTIELLLNPPVGKRPRTNRPQSISLLDIQFTDDSFDEVAQAHGFVQQDDWWYADGVLPLRATWIIGNGWSALEGENTYMESLEGGGMATKADEVFFAMKDLSPRRSAMFFKSREIRNEDFVAVISSFRYFK